MAPRQPTEPPPEAPATSVVEPPRGHLERELSSDKIQILDWLAAIAAAGGRRD